MNVFLLSPDQDFDLTQKLPDNASILIQDLELDTLFESMAQGDRFLFDIAKPAVLFSLDSTDAISYRQEILKDCLKHPEVIRQIYHLPLQAIENKRRQWMGIFSHYPGAILRGSREMLQMFIGLLKELRIIADEHAEAFTSRGFIQFFAMIRRELDDDYFSVVQRLLKELQFQHGILLSAELGQGNEGCHTTLRKPNSPGGTWLTRVLTRKTPTYSFTLHPRDNAGARALSELRDRGLNSVADKVAQSADHIDNFFKTLRQELAFYLGCLNVHQELSQLQEPIAFPQPVTTRERLHSFAGLYDVTLALTLKQGVVGNNVNADNKNLILITGANQGGKTTFLRSIGLAQLMMQCGMFVAAESFSANLCRGLFTHFKREEDASMKSGKLDEELARMDTIVGELEPDTLVLFNESFAATNEREGSEIARQIVTALLEQRIKVFFVTHLYKFAGDYFAQKLDHSLFLRATRTASGERTYQLQIRAPLPTSYGLDLYHSVFDAGKPPSHP
ncbi:MAG TPA: DNA mismatch repair protein MutS [Gammaproteobacteria bacterium]|nr:DNA mismatch repair protein MutS [Gammaproteobacteria bacterium]